MYVACATQRRRSPRTPDVRRQRRFGPCRQQRQARWLALVPCSPWENKLRPPQRHCSSFENDGWVAMIPPFCSVFITPEYLFIFTCFFFYLPSQTPSTPFCPSPAKMIAACCGVYFFLFFRPPFAVRNTCRVVLPDERSVDVRSQPNLHMCR